jgi:hypothetical protein
MHATNEFREIDRLTDRLLRAAGARYKFPTPVDDIVEAQHMYIAREEESIFSPAVLAQAPLYIQEKMRGFGHKLLAGLVRSERKIHLSSDGLDVQKRFWTCHEVGHDVCSEVQVLYLDSGETLTPAVGQSFEREANYAATRLLFQGSIFDDEARDLPQTIASVKLLGDLFGASIHSTLWLFAETALEPIGVFVLHSPVQDDNEELQFRVKNVYVSETFDREFGVRASAPHRLSTVDHPDLKTAWNTVRRFDTIGEGELSLMNRRSEETGLHFELFSNSYTLFLLLSRPALRLVHGAIPKT